eukprot:2186830-Rhodomonas_salina.2
MLTVNRVLAQAEFEVIRKTASDTPESRKAIHTRLKEPHFCTTAAPRGGSSDRGLALAHRTENGMTRGGRSVPLALCDEDRGLHDVIFGPAYVGAGVLLCSLFCERNFWLGLRSNLTLSSLS